jgi:hypothetical protein
LVSPSRQRGDLFLPRAQHRIVGQLRWSRNTLGVGGHAERRDGARALAATGTPGRGRLAYQGGREVVLGLGDVTGRADAVAAR